MRKESRLQTALTSDALNVWALLKQKGACLVEDIQRLSNLTREQTQHALWELAAAGLAAADGFDQLRTMIEPGRRSAFTATHRRMRSAAGRWSLFNADLPKPADALEAARRADASVESAARMLMARYGVVFRDLIVRESNIPRWGALLRMLRRLEDRGEVRGGRFVSGFGGEQFALPEAVESLRAARTRSYPEAITIAGADPMNLIGILVPGDRVPAVAGRTFIYRDDLNSASDAPPSRPRKSMPPRQHLFPVRGPQPRRIPSVAETLSLF